jgi:oxygen-dependent protoporphyrinogen oxidase
VTDLHVTVVGAGIAGLGAAHHLAEAGATVTVLEREAAPGGRMRSVRWHDRWVDVGGEEITSGDSFFVDVAARHGLTVIPHLAGAGGYGVWRDGRVHMIELTDPKSLLRFSGMSGRGRAQLLRLLPTLARQAWRGRGAQIDEPWRAADIDDASLEEWMGRRAPEFLEYVIEPLFDVFCGWTPEEMSRGWFAFTSTIYGNATGFTVLEGIGGITRALASELDVRCGAAVTEVDATRRAVTYRTNDGREHTLEGDAVVVATPGHMVGGIVSGLDPARQDFFDRVRYVPHDQTFFWVRSVPDHVPPVAFFPRREDTEFASIGVGLPTDKAAPVVRLGLKGTVQRELGELSDDEFAERTLKTAARYFPELPSQVEDHLVWRWAAALPVFYPGYLRLLDRFIHLPRLPGVRFAGDYLANAATGAAYASGRRAAMQLLHDTRK